ATGAWWSERAGGMVGGGVGAFLGCFASLLGTLAAKGKARGFVLASLKVMIGLGVVSTVVGLLALGLRQPAGVWCVLLLLGAILLVIVPARLKHFHRGYEEMEMRRMAAIDA
ncbi:MAG TPA: hypothetical protein VHI52_06595, partial [Verrucomicrobiae bacterium]|nr:hypothetical protein [Verrucomicrobiae bacterium]